MKQDSIHLMKAFHYFPHHSLPIVMFCSLLLVTLLYMRGPLNVIFLLEVKWMQIIAKTVHKFSKWRQGCHIHVPQQWEAFNLLHTFPRCSHRSRWSAILSNTLGSQLGFWKTFPKGFPKPFQVFSNNRSFSRLASCNIILLCLTEALLSLSIQWEQECL